MLIDPKYLPIKKGVRINELQRAGSLGCDTLQIPMGKNQSGDRIFLSGEPPNGGFAVIIPWKHDDGRVRALKIWHEKFFDVKPEIETTMGRRLEILWEHFVSNDIERHLVEFLGYHSPIMEWTIGSGKDGIQNVASGYEFEWAEGSPLQERLSEIIPKGKVAQRKQLETLEKIHKNFRTLVREVADTGARQPDFNWKNIVVNDDAELKLIDIDSIWVPAMEDDGIKGIATNTQHFSHPNLSHKPASGQPHDISGNSLFNIGAEWYQYHQLDLSFRCALEFYPMWLEVVDKSVAGLGPNASPLSGEWIAHGTHADKEKFEALLEHSSAELRVDLEKFKKWSCSEIEEVEKPIWIDIPSSSLPVSKLDFSPLLDTESLSEARSILKELGYKKRIHKDMLHDFLGQISKLELLELDETWGGSYSDASEKSKIVKNLLRVITRQPKRILSPPPPQPLPMSPLPIPFVDDAQSVGGKFLDAQGELLHLTLEDYRSIFSRAGVQYSRKEIAMELEHLTVPNLKNIAHVLDLSVKSRMRKAEIIQDIVDKVELPKKSWSYIPGYMKDDEFIEKKVSTTYRPTRNKGGQSRNQSVRSGAIRRRTQGAQKRRVAVPAVPIPSTHVSISTRNRQQRRTPVPSIASPDSIDTFEPYFKERQENRGKYGWDEFIKLRPIPNLFIVFTLSMIWHFIPELSAGLIDSAAIITGVVFWLVMELYLAGYVYSVDEVTGYDAGFKKWDDGIWNHSEPRFDDKYLLQYAYQMKPVGGMLILCGVLSVFTSFFPSPLHETFPGFFKLEMWFAVIHLILVIILFVRWSSFQSLSSNNFTLITKILMFSAISTIILAVVSSQWDIFSGSEVKGFSIGSFYFGVIITTMSLLFNRFTSFNILTDKYPIFDRLNVFLTLSLFPIFCGFNIDVETYANEHTLGILLLLISTWYLVELVSLLQENHVIKEHSANYNKGTIRDTEFQLSLLYRIFYSLLPLLLIILCMVLLGMVEIPRTESSWIWD